MQEIKVSDIFTEHCELVRKIRRLIDENPLLKEKFTRVTTNKGIHLIEASEDNIFTIEKGLLSLREAFYVKSEKFTSGVNYRIVKVLSNDNKHIITQICLTEDFVLVSDNEAIISIVVNDYYNHSTVYLVDKKRNKSFMLRELWSPDKAYQFDNVIFEKYIDRFYMRIHKYE